MKNRKRMNDNGMYHLKMLETISLACSQDIDYKLEDVAKELNLSDEQKKERADVINKISVSSLDTDENGDFIFIENVLFKASVLLAALGYHETAKELLVARRARGIERKFRIDAANDMKKDAIKEHYSKAASAPRNKFYSEIMKVIEATWKKYPAGSKKEMIRKIMARYPNQVSEDTLKRWIKESGLQPPTPKKYERIHLVETGQGA